MSKGRWFPWMPPESTEHVAKKLEDVADDLRVLTSQLRDEIERVSGDRHPREEQSHGE